MLLLTADDRTGALETGGACADLGFEARFLSDVGGMGAFASGETTSSARCAIMDLNTRHCSPAQARERMAATLALPARPHCHKMDSGLRGNWHHEVAALIEAGRRVGLLASFPAAGRRCRHGTVYIDDVPVAESAFGSDPRNRLISSRPADFLAAAGCAQALQTEDIVVLDANDDHELRAAAARCHAEGRTLIGTTGGIGAYAAQLPSAAPAADSWRSYALKRPALIVCGSLHPLSRTQIAALDCVRLPLHRYRQAARILAAGADATLATNDQTDAVDDAAADATAVALADAVRHCLATGHVATLVVLGGDTAAAVLGERELSVLGSLDVGVPLCRDDAAALEIVTKGGGIGTPETLARLLARQGS